MIKTTFQKRKDLVNAIAEFTGTQSRYLGPPSFAYEAGGFVIDRNGCIENETPALVQFLAEQGFTEHTPIIEEAMQENPDDQIRESSAAAGQADEGTAINSGTTHKMHFKNPTAREAVNLMNILYSRQYLINSSMGTEVIRIPQSSIERIQLIPFDKHSFDEIKGVEIEGDDLVFIIPELEKGSAYEILLSRIMERSKNCKRCRADLREVENEKYYMRSWIIRLGLGGSSNSEIRRELMRGLKGNPSFRTAAGLDASKAKQKAKRSQLKNTEKMCN